METGNPYDPPQSELIDPDQERGPAGAPRVPWEDREGYPGLGARVLGTMKLVFQPSLAGPALGLHPRLGPAVTYFACIGLPLVWAMSVATALLGPADPNSALLDRLGLPHQAPPPALAEFQKTIQVVVALCLPVSMALGVGVIGLASHGGLWLVKGLRAGRGLPATFRTLLYAYGTFNGILWIFHAWVLLPPLAGLVLLGLSVVLSVGFFVHAGLLLARAHGTDLWRGVVGILLPWLVLGCCCGGGLFALGFLAAFAARAR